MVGQATRQILCAWALLLPAISFGFTVRTTFPQTSSLSGRSASSSTELGAKSLIVVSPPGGVGEVSAVKAATMGASVKWFVVSPPPAADVLPGTQEQVVLSQQALKEIADAGGKVELAGSDSPSLLIPQDDQQSAIAAVSTWCGAADAIVCTYDGAEISIKKQEDQERQAVWKNAIKVAAKEATKSVSGNKVAVLSAEEAVVMAGDEEEESKGGIGNLVGSLLGSKVDIPSTLADAMGSARNSLTLRYGKLFGTPESSPDFSPLVGGPKKFPELCEEYLMRNIRVDPTLSMSGNLMLSGSTTRSSRHAIGEAAARMALDLVPVQLGLDVSISSQLGSDPVTSAMWEEEYTRVKEMLSSGKGAQLFSNEFGSVPDVPRLADWLATKWAPAVLRTYDIAAIRVGARPVYVTQPQEDVVEIVWQKLVDFESVIVGKMTIQVSDTGLVALRGAGDAARGFGEISRVPLAGEDVLVRRLAEASSQAIEKGLANKPAKKTIEIQMPAPEKPVEPVAVVSSLQSSGTIVEKSAAAPSTETGPRQAGVRRSKERSRGKRRKSAPTEESE
uniref:Uncharacterized protein n=1 Tax=Entomoneis paludosa TaxID=265537 RepID=A0A7S3DNQ2_9STRA